MYSAISKNIESINNVIQESSAGVAQIAASAEDLSRLTINLQELISRFKFENDENQSNKNKMIGSENRLRVYTN